MADPSLHDGDCFHRFCETASRTWETWRGWRERAASAKQTQDLSLWARACEAEPTWEFNDANCGCRPLYGPMRLPKGDAITAEAGDRPETAVAPSSVSRLPVRSP